MLIIYSQQARFACLRCAACRHCVSADLPSGRLGILEKQYVTFLFYTKYAGLPFVYGYINETRTVAELLFRDKYNVLHIKSTNPECKLFVLFEYTKFALLKIIILK